MVAETNTGLEVLLIILAVVWLVIWVVTLLHQAKRRRYTWLVINALVQLTLVIYWLVFVFSPNFRKVAPKDQ